MDDSSPQGRIGGRRAAQCTHAQLCFHVCVHRQPQDGEVETVEHGRDIQLSISLAPFSSLNMTQKASVNIQRSCKFFLCVAALDTELADTRSALFYVISHCVASNLEFKGYAIRD